MERKEIIEQLVKKGSNMIRNVKVKNVTVTNLENYTRLGLTLDRPVKGMVEDENHKWVEGETNVIFVSLFSITSILKDNDDAAFAANHLVKNPDGMSIVLSRATIDIIQESVKEKEEYVNPWSENGTATIFQHDTIINHVVGLTLSDFAIRKLDKLADAILGF